MLKPDLDTPEKYRLLFALAGRSNSQIICGIHEEDFLNIVEQFVEFVDQPEDTILFQISTWCLGYINQCCVNREGDKQTNAYQLLVATPWARNLIRENSMHMLFTIVQHGHQEGMYTRDQYLSNLVLAGSVSEQKALLVAHCADTLVSLLNVKSELARKGENKNAK